jgi:hypothetical protein
MERGHETNLDGSVGPVPALGAVVVELLGVVRFSSFLSRVVVVPGGESSLS